MSKKHPVDPKKLTELVIKHKEASKQDPNVQISDDLGRMLYQLVTNMIKSRNFYHVQNKEDMVQEAVLECFQRLHRFDPYKISKKTGKPSTAFSFFSQITFFNFLRQINKVNERTTKHYDHMKDILSFELSGEERDIFEKNFQGHFEARESYTGKFSKDTEVKEEKLLRPKFKRSSGKKRRLF